MALHPVGGPDRLPGCRPRTPALTTILVLFVIAAVVILPSPGLLYILDQKRPVGKDLT